MDQQISGSAIISGKLALPFECIFMDKVRFDFLETQEFKSLVWFHYIDNICVLKKNWVSLSKDWNLIRKLNSLMNLGKSGISFLDRELL